MDPLPEHGISNLPESLRINLARERDIRQCVRHSVYGNYSRVPKSNMRDVQPHVPSGGSHIGSAGSQHVLPQDVDPLLPFLQVFFLTLKRYAIKESIYH